MAGSEEFVRVLGLVATQPNQLMLGRLPDLQMQGWQGVTNLFVCWGSSLPNLTSLCWDGCRTCRCRDGRARRICSCVGARRYPT